MLFVLRAGTCCYMALIADVWRSPFDHEGSDSEYASVDEESGADDDSSRNAADAHGLPLKIFGMGASWWIKSRSTCSKRTWNELYFKENPYLL